MIRVGYGVTVLSSGMASHGIDGIGNYTKELLFQLYKNSDVDIIPFGFGGNIPSEIDNNDSAIMLKPYAKQALYSNVTTFPFWGHKELNEEVDIVHATDHLIPKLRTTPVIATLMDAIPLSHPEWVTYRFRRLKNEMWRRASHWATHIITISEYSKIEIMEHFGIPEDKITVIPLAVDKRWYVVASRDAIVDVSKRLGLPENYCLSVGTIQPRKNIKRVIAAHQALPDMIRNEYPLLIVGRNGWGSDDVISYLKNTKPNDNIHWLEYVDDSDLQIIMSHAKLLVFPSLHEGFGLPALEAMAAGTPVITSDTTSLPEVVSDAALLVDPVDVSSISEAMLRIIDDEDLAVKLIKKGIIKAREFTWDKTAKLTIDAYKKIAEQ